MNPVEIEQAVSRLCEQPFDAEAFPFNFLRAYDTPDATIRKLRKGSTNHSDIGGVLRRLKIHIKVAEPGGTEQAASEATQRYKARFLLATDGEELLAEDRESGDVLATTLAELPNHFGFWLMASVLLWRWCCQPRHRT